MFMGFTLHFYIIFGTNLLTGGLAQIAVFLPISVFKEKEYKRSPNGIKPSEKLFSERKQSRELGVQVKEASRKPRGRGRALHPRGALVAPPTYFFLLYIYPCTPPPNIQEHYENLIPPSEPSVLERSHLGAFSGAPPEGALITEGLYINSMAPPMMCE